MTIKHRTYERPVEPGHDDQVFLRLIRANVDEFIARVVCTSVRMGTRVLDVAPEVHKGIGAHHVAGWTVETLDVSAENSPTFVADLCALPPQVPRSAYDIVVCTEVLEHVLDPFSAVQGIWDLLKPGGLAAVSCPFNFRIHGPLPDCWRFSEHGLRCLFRRFEIVELTALETPGRPLMPIHYTLIARRPASAA
jgi:hypothetical protein